MEITVDVIEELMFCVNYQPKREFSFVFLRHTLSFSKEVCFIKMGWAPTCIFETYRFQSFFFINDILGDIVFVLLHFPIFRFLFIRRVYDPYNQISQPMVR